MTEDHESIWWKVTSPFEWRPTNYLFEEVSRCIWLRLTYCWLVQQNDLWKRSKKSGLVVQFNAFCFTSLSDFLPIKDTPTNRQWLQLNKTSSVPLTGRDINSILSYWNTCLVNQKTRTLKIPFHLLLSLLYIIFTSVLYLWFLNSVLSFFFFLSFISWADVRLNLINTIGVSNDCPKERRFQYSYFLRKIKIYWCGIMDNPSQYKAFYQHLW